MMVGVGKQSMKTYKIHAKNEKFIYNYVEFIPEFESHSFKEKVNISYVKL